MLKRPNGYKDLIVWQKSMDMTTLVFALVKDFPKEETFGLAAQMKRSAVSVPSNIAEGSRRGSARDFQHFLSLAYGSASELETRVELTKRLQFGKEHIRAKLDDVLQEVLRMLNRMSSSNKVVGSR